MDKKRAQELAENAGLTWLTTKDYGDELLRFAELVAANEREECAVLCEKHYREPMILRATTIDEDPFRGAALDCAELIRMRSNGEVRGASRLAGEASSREAATSTVVLGG